MKTPAHGFTLMNSTRRRGSAGFTLMNSKFRGSVGFTLIELLVVVALISLFVFPILFGIRQTGQTQNLRTSVSVLSDDLQSVKVSAREAREKSSWGIISTTSNTYQIVKGNKNAPSIVSNRVLQNGIVFVDQFSVWFEIGTGNAMLQTIHVQNMNNQKYDILINELGTISVMQL